LTLERPASTPAQRLFFALWPDEEARRALRTATAKAVRRSGGRPVPASTLHVTLAFLGSVPTTRIPELQRVAGEQARALAQDAPLSLTFERLVHWSRPHILCALAAEEASGAAVLAAALKDAAAAAGFTPDLKPFHAHVTLARKVAHAADLPAVLPVLWRFAEFVLVDSRTDPSGPVYSVIESYSLVKAQKARE
jgi:RNA 2',3'-cyclic 3'-phosphodiesterase